MAEQNRTAVDARGAREATEGMVFSYIHHNGKLGVLIEVEGDVAPELLKELCQHITAVTPVPLGVNESDVPAEVIAKSREDATRIMLHVHQHGVGVCGIFTYEVAAV